LQASSHLGLGQQAFSFPSRRHYSEGNQDAPREGITIRIGRRNLIREHRAYGGFKEEYSVPKGGGLGEGGFSTVFTAVAKHTGVRRAAKIIAKSRLKDDPDLFENEVKAMMELDHPHVVKLIEFYDEKD
jgi:calcium-dependent protein kinase